MTGSRCWTGPRARGSAEAADSGLLALHAILQLHFGAPAPVIAAWIAKNDLGASLARRERLLLVGGGGLTDRQRTDLFWYVEALWAMAWAGQLVPDLPVDRPVGDVLASLLPQIRRDEGAAAFRRAFQLRPTEALFGMLDLYYRAHWYARDGRLNGRPTAPFDLDVIMERRKALEWLNDRTIEDWDDTPEDT